MLTKLLEITGYHAHVYFGPGTLPSALKLREKIQEEFGTFLTMHSVADGPRGPHVEPMFGVDIPLTKFAEVVGFLLLNHGPHSILIHPVSGHELLDHTHHALWLGIPQPLNLRVLVANES